MDILTQALSGATASNPQTLRPLESALIVGGGGVLGSAVLAEALVAGRFQRVAAVVDGPLASAVRGFVPLPLARLQDGTALGCEIAIVVYERQRHSNGRDDAFHLPVADQLLPLARALHTGGVQRLIVLVPHAPALLPQALKAGFASQDEGAVAALGFEHLIFLRAAQNARGGRSAGNGLERFAAWWLSQLQWMVPEREQPVRAVKLAQLAVLLAQGLGTSAQGTRVLPPELLWRAAQTDKPEQVLQAWLHASQASAGQ